MKLDKLIENLLSEATISAADLAKLRAKKQGKELVAKKKEDDDNDRLVSFSSSDAKKTEDTYLPKIKEALISFLEIVTGSNSNTNLDNDRSNFKEPTEKEFNDAKNVLLKYLNGYAKNINKFPVKYEHAIDANKVIKKVEDVFYDQLDYETLEKPKIYDSYGRQGMINAVGRLKLGKSISVNPSAKMYNADVFVDLYPVIRSLNKKVKNDSPFSPENKKNAKLTDKEIIDKLSDSIAMDNLSKNELNAKKRFEDMKNAIDDEDEKKYIKQREIEKGIDKLGTAKMVKNTNTCSYHSNHADGLNALRKSSGIKSTSQAIKASGISSKFTPKDITSILKDWASENAPHDKDHTMYLSTNIFSDNRNQGLGRVIFIPGEGSDMENPIKYNGANGFKVSKVWWKNVGAEEDSEAIRTYVHVMTKEENIPVRKELDKRQGITASVSTSYFGY